MKKKRVKQEQKFKVEKSSGVKSLISIEEFLSTKVDLRDEVKAGFRIFTQGRQYKYSFKDFEIELENYFNRKYGGGV